MQAEPGTGRAEKAARSEGTLADAASAHAAAAVAVDTTADTSGEMGLETGSVRAGVAETGLVDVIQVVEEVVRISKREVETGRVRLHKTVREVDEPVEVLLRQEELEVERIPTPTSSPSWKRCWLWRSGSC